MKTKRKTCRRYNTPGHAHALTFSCYRRQRFLVSDRTRQWLVQAVEAARRRHRFDLWAWVIMPEHAHVLILPRDPVYDISRMLSTIKLSVTRRALAWARRSSAATLARMADVQPNGDCHHRFWQRGGGYDRNLIRPDAVWRHIDYIHHNPVRRGLCRRPVDWAWSSAREHEGMEAVAMRIDRESLPVGALDA